MFDNFKLGGLGRTRLGIENGDVRDAGSQGEATRLEQRCRALLAENASLKSQNANFRAENKDAWAKVDHWYQAACRMHESLDCKEVNVHDLAQRLGSEKKIVQGLKRRLDHNLAECSSLNELIGSERKRVHERGEQIRRLEEEILQYKRIVGSSDQPENQLMGTSIQESMNSLFYAVRDWALHAVRQQKHEFSLPGHMEAFYGKYVSDRKSTIGKVHTLMAAFAYALAYHFDQLQTFGMASDGPVATANALYLMINEFPAVEVRKKKRWASLTNDILSKEQNVVDQAVTQFTDTIVETVQSVVEAAYSLPATPLIGDKLRTAIKSHMPILRLLRNQEAEYSMLLPELNPDNKPLVFHSEFMEAVDEEEASGLVEASIFPVVYKEEMSKDDGTASHSQSKEASALV